MSADRFHPSTFDATDPQLRGIFVDTDAAWAACEAHLRTFGASGVMTLLPHFWQMETVVFDLTRRIGTSLFVAQPDNLPLAAAAIRGADIDAVIAGAHEALAFASYLKDKKIEAPHVWFIVQRADDIVDLSALHSIAKHVEEEVQRSPGVPAHSDVNLQMTHRPAESAAEGSQSHIITGLDGLQELLAIAADNSRSDLYRRVWNRGSDEAVPRLTSLEDWHTVPLLDKDALIATPFLRRIFIPKGQIDHIRPSSGTSGKAPLFSPRTHLRHMDYRLEYHDFKGALLAFTVPAMPHWHRWFGAHAGGSPHVVAFDPREPDACARLSRDAGVTGMSLFAFHVPMIGEAMKKIGTTENIRFIEIAGEACTHELLQYIRATFPNATTIPFYGSSEVEDCPIGMPCRAIDGREPLSEYHGKPSAYLELVDPDSGAHVPIVQGAEGELVISAYPGEPSALPLVRFRTGDIARVVSQRCQKHRTWSFTVLGRAHLDFVKIPGGIIRADEIARALRSLGCSDRFELHIYEEASTSGPKVRPVLYLESGSHDCTEKVADAIRVGPEATLGSAARAGRILPLQCQIYEPKSGVKMKRIVRH